MNILRAMVIYVVLLRLQCNFDDMLFVIHIGYYI